MIEITGFLDIQLLFLSVHFFSFLAMPRNLIGWHHRLNGHEFEQALGDSKGQGSLLCCSPWGLQRVRQDWVTEQQQWLVNFLEICHFKAWPLYSSYLINNLTFRQICVKQREKKIKESRICKGIAIVLFFLQNSDRKFQLVLITKQYIKDKVLNNFHYWSQCCMYW